VVYPTDGAVAVLAPSGVIKGAKNPNAAKLLVDFFLGFEYSKLISENYEQSLRGDVPPPKGAKSLAELTLFQPTLEHIEKELPGLRNKWRDLFNG